MNVIECPLSGLKVIEPKIFYDNRGYFFESWSQRDFDREVSPVVFVQDNESKSCAGVVRGLHFQTPPYAQSKLVRCVSGKVLDIALDIRKGSPTYGKHFSVVLDAEKHNQFFIPQGFAHGFVGLTPDIVFQYKCDNYYAPDHYDGINILDKALGLDLPDLGLELILSDKDKQHPNLCDYDSPFIYGVNC